MKADPQTEMAVMAVMDRLAGAYAARDMDLLLSCIASDPDTVMYGTGADEKRVGRDQIRAQAQRDWSQSDSSALRYNWTSVAAAGDVAWIAADANFEVSAGGEQLSLPARITAVLEKRGGQWQIAQSHFSLPAAGQEAGESFPT